MSKIPLLILLFSIALFADDRVFVRQFKSPIIDSANCATLTDFFASELKSVSGWEIVTYHDMISMIDQQLDKDLMDCNDESCMQEIAGMLGAPYVVSGNIARLGSYHILTVSLNNILEGTSKSKAKYKAKSFDGIIDNITQVAQELAGIKPVKSEPAPVQTLPVAGEPKKSTPVKSSVNDTKGATTVFFNSLPPMAEVYENGRYVGKTNVDPIPATPGRHRYVFKKGNKEAAMDVTLREGRNTAPMVRLKDKKSAAKSAEKPGEIKGVIVLRGVTFLSGKAVLTSESYGVLDKIVASLKAWPQVKVKISGHTDSVGSEESNRRLSSKRADAVKNYFISQGINSNRLRAIGIGEDAPIASNSTAAGRATNRRIELSRIN